MTHNLDADDFFILRVQQRCAEKRLSFFLVEPLWVRHFCDALLEGRVWPRVLLNMHSEHHLPGDVFHQLVKHAAQRNTRVIDPPDRAIAAFDKAQMHARLAANGFTVPYTVIVPAEAMANFKLSDEQKARLGAPFVIKPSMGYGRRGVLLNAEKEEELRVSAAQWASPHYLIQQKISPAVINGAPAYFRVFYVFGSIWHCGWNCFTDRYRLLTASDEATAHLPHLTGIITRLAGLSGMQFFSTEIALTESGQFVLIDYVNDQCHMLSQSADPGKGVPDQLVAGIADRLVEAAEEMIKAR